MNEFRQLRKWLLHLTETYPIGANPVRKWINAHQSQFTDRGWERIEGTEKFTFIHGTYPYIFKVGRELWREFRNYEWFMTWFPRNTLPTAIVHDNVIIQPRAGCVYPSMPEYEQLVINVKSLYRPNSEHLSSGLIYLCDKYMNYPDAHQGNLGLWRRAVRFLDFNGSYTTPQNLKAP